MSRCTFELLACIPCAETNVKFSHHDFDLGKDFMEQTTKLVFVLEEMKEKPKKRQGKQDHKA